MPFWELEYGKFINTVQTKCILSKDNLPFFDVIKPIKPVNPNHRLRLHTSFQSE